MRRTAHNTPNNDAPLFIEDSRGRSIAFAARECVVYSGESNGVVGRNVMRQHA